MRCSLIIDDQIQVRNRSKREIIVTLVKKSGFENSWKHS